MESLASRVENHYQESLERTLGLFPFDEKRQKDFEGLLSARGRNVTDFGNPAKVPIDEYKSFLLEEDLEITEMDPVVLIGQIKSGKFSCFDILRSCFHAAMVASRLTNCVYDFLPELALVVAKLGT